MSKFVFNYVNPFFLLYLSSAARRTVYAEFKKLYFWKSTCCKSVNSNAVTRVVTPVPLNDDNGIEMTPQSNARWDNFWRMFLLNLALFFFSAHLNFLEKWRKYQKKNLKSFLCILFISVILLFTFKFWSVCGTWIKICNTYIHCFISALFQCWRKKVNQVFKGETLKSLDDKDSYAWWGISN